MLKSITSFFSTLWKGILILLKWAPCEVSQSKESSIAWERLCAVGQDLQPNTRISSLYSPKCRNAKWRQAWADLDTKTRERVGNILHILTESQPEPGKVTVKLVRQQRQHNLIAAGLWPDEVDLVLTLFARRIKYTIKRRNYDTLDS